MATTRKEIVTIQAGHYSNFVGTHWWNLQEAAFVYDERQPTDINNDIFFREGKNKQGEETYLPRAVIIDLKGSLNTLKHYDDLYKESQRASVAWDGDISVYKEEPHLKNEFLHDIEDDEKEKIACKSSTDTEDQSSSSSTKFYNLNNEVKVWSDFLRMHIHPRSLYIVEEYSHLESESFDLFDAGAQLWGDCKVSEAVEDKIRFFTEECDYLQGFHLLVDGDNGFSAIGSGISSYFQEEYPKKDVIAFPTFPVNFNSTRKNIVRCLYNTAFVLENLSSSWLTVPLSLATTFGAYNHDSQKFQDVLYDPALNYHTSAILACGLDACTLPYRLRQNSFSMHDIVASTTVSNMKIAAASLGFPFSSVSGNIVDTIEELENESFKTTSLTCGIDVPYENVVFQTFGYKGFKSPELCKSNSAISEPNDSSRTTEDIIAQYIGRQFSNSMSSVKVARDFCNTTAPFPNMFSSRISRTGTILSEKRLENVVVEKVPALGGIHCTLKMRNVLETLCKDLVRLKTNKLVFGLESDEFEVVLENLRTSAACYSYCDE